MHAACIRSYADYERMHASVVWTRHKTCINSFVWNVKYKTTIMLTLDRPAVDVLKNRLCNFPRHKSDIFYGTIYCSIPLNGHVYRKCIYSPEILVVPVLHYQAVHCFRLSVLIFLRRTSTANVVCCKMSFKCQQSVRRISGAFRDVIGVELVLVWN